MKKALEANKALETPIYSPQEPFYAGGTCAGYPLNLDVAVTFGAHRLDFLANLVALLVIPIFLHEAVARGPGERQQHTDYQQGYHHDGERASIQNCGGIGE